MSSLEHHKKQAKQFVRWHRDGYVPVAALIRELLPRFAGMADHEILSATFLLCDAQDLVARRLGHESWSALAKGQSPMHAPQNSSRATILSAEPQLFVTDMRRSLAFYVDTLGFALAFSYGQPAFYAQVVRDAARLNLRSVDGAVYAADLREREADALSVTMTVDDPKPLFLEFQEAGAVFHQRLRTEPWGARTFIVSDPDRNLLAFAGR